MNLETASVALADVRKSIILVMMLTFQSKYSIFIVQFQLRDL